VYLRILRPKGGVVEGSFLKSIEKWPAIIQSVSQSVTVVVRHS
jgi:hypothetical protein